MKKNIAKSVDWFFNKLLPKKFLVVVVSTWLIVSGVQVPKEYWYILMVYIGGNVIKSFANVLNKEEKCADQETM